MLKSLVCFHNSRLAFQNSSPSPCSITNSRHLSVVDGYANFSGCPSGQMISRSAACSYRNHGTIKVFNRLMLCHCYVSPTEYLKNEDENPKSNSNKATLVDLQNSINTPSCVPQPMVHPSPSRNNTESESGGCPPLSIHSERLTVQIMSPSDDTSTTSTSSMVLPLIEKKRDCSTFLDLVDDLERGESFNEGEDERILSCWNSSRGFSSSSVESYPYEVATDEFYQGRLEDGFAEKFAHVRQTLDYSYHFNPTLERQHVQDSIIHDVLEMGVEAEEPWLIFTAGAMGAGKSWCIKRLSEKGYFNDRCFVWIDPDDMRRRLPEYQGFVQHNRSTAGYKTHQEAGLMTEIALEEALRRGKHALVDTSLRDWRWFQDYFHRVRQQFPTRKIAIIHVKATKDQVYERAEKRARKTGREVPKELLDQAMEQVPISVEKLSPLTNYTATIVNAEHRLELLSGDRCWKDFQSRWHICGTLGMDPDECQTNTIIFPDDYISPIHEFTHPSPGSCRTEYCSVLENEDDNFPPCNFSNPKH